MGHCGQETAYGECSGHHQGHLGRRGNGAVSPSGGGRPRVEGRSPFRSHSHPDGSRPGNRTCCSNKPKLSHVPGVAPTQVSVERALALALEGEKLIDSRHYAVDSIRPKCHELQHLCNQFAAEVERRRELLSKSLELHSLLEAVRPLPMPSWSRMVPLPTPAPPTWTAVTGWKLTPRPAVHGPVSRPSQSQMPISRIHLPQLIHLAEDQKFSALGPSVLCVNESRPDDARSLGVPCSWVAEIPRIVAAASGTGGPRPSTHNTHAKTQPLTGPLSPSAVLGVSSP